MSDPMVTVAEIAAATGRKADDVEREAADLGMFVKPDWAGRAALPVAEARELVSGDRRRTLEHERAWAQHLADSKAWQQARGQAIHEAAQKVRARVGTLGSGAVSAEARDAAVEAAERYERTVPRPCFNGVYSVHLEYIE
jgi:hypothetical protein